MAVAMGWVGSPLSHARTTGQTINPSARGPSAAELDCRQLPKNFLAPLIEAENFYPSPRCYQ